MKQKLLKNSEVMALVVSMRERMSKDQIQYPRIYGVPRGGIPVAYLLAEISTNACLVDSPSDANIIVDDIIDSGATKLAYQKFEAGFYALIENKEPDTWVVFPWEGTVIGSAEDIPLRLLQFIGENPGRDGLKDTPKRVVKSWTELYAGYNMDPVAILGRVFDNDEKYNEMVTLRDIQFYSICEHHLLPFFGKIHIGYIPLGKVVGISKLARLVECFARRVQIQERLTQQIADTIEQVLKPLGVAVLVEAQHFCMTGRGVQKQDAMMVTSAISGEIKTNAAARAEFLALCHGGK